MNLSDLRLELKSRFGAFIGDTRADRLLNEAYQDLIERYEWPFLSTTTTGAAPLTVTDLRRLVYVVDSTTHRRLRPLNIDSIVEVDPELVSTSPAEFYWVDPGASSHIIRSYPATTDSLSIRYVKRAPDLTVGTDVPLFPTRYHVLIVDVAQVRALTQGPNPGPEDRDGGRAANLSTLTEQKVARMAAELLTLTEPQTFIQGEGEWDLYNEEQYGWVVR